MDGNLELCNIWLVTNGYNESKLVKESTANEYFLLYFGTEILQIIKKNGVYTGTCKDIDRSGNELNVEINGNSLLDVLIKFYAGEY